MDKIKTSISQITVANEKLYTETARLTKQSKADVKSQVEFVGEFIKGVIKEGNMQGVMIPYFGKFKPKEKMLKAMKKRQLERGTGMDTVLKIIKGKIVEQPNTTDNETI